MLLVVQIIVFAFLFFLVYASVAKYHPKDIEEVCHSSNPSTLKEEQEYSVITWNTGYCGLDKSMDFFYDGGTRMRTSMEETEKNLAGITQTISDLQPVDFIMLQEVDVLSRRSYGINQFSAYCDKFGETHYAFAINYDVPFVPLPLKSPMGKVIAGLATFGNYKPLNCVRYQFKVSFPWPKSAFMLDRCFMVNRYKITNDKELLLINLHNSAFDKGGNLRQKESIQLRDFMIAEYEKGNYIIAGGDWNQLPKGFSPHFTDYVFDTKDCVEMIPDLLPNDWIFAFDNTVPTNRQVVTPFDKSITPTRVIDFFLLSPNVELVEVHNHDYAFEYSDHNPVKLRFKMKP